MRVECYERTDDKDTGYPHAPVRISSDILRAAADWTWAVDAAGRVTMMCEGVTRLCRWPAHSAIGHRFSDLGVWLSPDVGDFTHTEAFASTHAFRDFEYDLVDADGCPRRQRVSGVPVFEPGTGHFAGFQGTGVDQAETRRLHWEIAQPDGVYRDTLATLRHRNRELDHALDAVRSADRAKTNFLAQMSHELRTPLNGIIAYSEAVSAGVIPADSAKYAEIIGAMGHAGKHLLSMLGDIMDLAAIERDTIRLDVETVALGEAIAEAFEMVRMEFDSRGLDAAPIRSDTDLRVRADRRRVIQILVNLLQNALKYGSKGGVIGIDVSEAGETKATGLAPAVDVVVWDAGPGIPLDQRESIFNAFTRLDEDPATQPSAGIGLGLALSRRLARTMGGDLWAGESAEGGAALALRLPHAA